MKIVDAFLELLYPPRCIVCDEPISHFGYCEYCKGKVKPIKDVMCFSCGIDVKNCQCKYFIYHFDGVTAPYYNEKYAQQAVYDLKFRGRFNCVKNFGSMMAKYAAKTFGVENIDLICSVPSSKQTLLKRGFNQSELFAREISKRLNCKYNPKLILHTNKSKTQHRLKTVDDRFENVRGAYLVKEKVKGKNILLVDDIKTSGATLDECARQLKFAGAERVYCVVALVSAKAKNGELGT